MTTQTISIGAHPRRDPRERGGLRGVLARHPLASFFIMANILSWLAWTPYIL